MKYALNNYVKAFINALEVQKDKDAIVSNLVKSLKKSGDIKNSRKIINGIAQELIRRGGGNLIRIETARELSEERKELIKGKFSAKDRLVFDINAQLTAGIRITVNGEEEVDNSLNNKLNKLFR